MPKAKIASAGRFLAAFFLIFCSAAAHAGDEQAQPYEKVRYPTFKEGRLESMLEAEQAEAYDMTLGTPRVVLRDVYITLYDNSEKTRAETPEDQPLPVRAIITSDRGFLTRRPPEPGAQPEQIVNLEGNVIMKQLRRSDNPPKAPSATSNLPPEIETEIRCEHAQWNNTLRKLNGDGEVQFIQEDSRIFGTGFLYLADDDAVENKTSSSNLKDWGGIAFIEHNARMEIEREEKSGEEPVKTVITCKDTASYKLRDREIQFEKDVRVHRPGLIIESDILKVFLRREDDPQPPDAQKEALPGQVKNIVATIGNRPGSVVITGFQVDPVTRTETVQFLARGGRADFDYDANRITLTDPRDQRRPEVEFGVDHDRITDNSIVFQLKQVKKAGVAYAPPSALRPESPAAKESVETTLDSLTTSGGRGEVVLRSRQSAGDGVPGAGPTIPTIVNYRGDMAYNRQAGRIRFEEKVYLKRADLAINAERLDVQLIPEGDSEEPTQVNRIIAETDVEIRTETYHAKAQRAEYDIFSGETGPTGSGLDTLRLFGTHPTLSWIRDDKGNQITAPEIHMQRLKVGPGQRDQHLMVARGGVSVCDFVTEEATAAEKAKVVSVKCEKGMEYNQANRRARFIGDVMVTSDHPEDNYVLTSDRLILDFEESPKSDDPDNVETWIRRITAEGNARLMQDTRVCEAINIIRDFPTPDPNVGDIYLQGALYNDGRPPQLAVYREQAGGDIGSMFAAPLIKSTSKGDLIQANGPGQLSAPDDEVDPATGRKKRSTINFQGAASYEALQGGLVSDARFWGGVTLIHPSQGVTVKSEEMDARFMKEDAAAAFGGAATNVDVERLGRLRRVEARNNVTLDNIDARGRVRTAVGDIGVVDFTPTGNILRLTADRSVDNNRYVMTRDQDGMTLRSPEVEIRQAQGITRAAGPGDLQIPPGRSGEGAEVPTRVLYRENGSMVYNELALSIRITDRVRIVQPGVGNDWSRPSLDGICDRMDIALLEPPAAAMSGEDALSRVQRMDAVGNVLMRVYADPPPENPNMDWLSRPGTTFFTRGDHAVYDVRGGQMSISSNDGRRPQLLLNMVEPGDPPRRQRLRADRFVMQTNTTPRRWNYEGELKADAIRDGEPFDFTSDY